MGIGKDNFMAEVTWVDFEECIESGHGDGVKGRAF